jgi:serine/threonine protein phosphatase PrpC
MVSDGIFQEEEDSKWLDSFLSKASELSPEEIVYRICLRASEDVHHDDCSAVAVRISLCDESAEVEEIEEIA